MKLIDHVAATRPALSRLTPGSRLHSIHQYMRLVQHRRWVMYVIILGILGVLVGYYSLPRFHVFYLVVGFLSLAVGVQLSIMRQHRRTWQSERAVRLLDALERLCGGLMLMVLCVGALIGENVPHEIFVAVVGWCEFWITAGNAAGEYWWQWYRFPRLETSEQLRYLCRHRPR